MPAATPDALSPTARGSTTTTRAPSETASAAMLRPRTPAPATARLIPPRARGWIVEGIKDGARRPQTRPSCDGGGPVRPSGARAGDALTQLRPTVGEGGGD